MNCCTRLILPVVFGLFTTLSIAQDRMMFVKNDKNPGVAFTLSMFAPGAGQMYNDQVNLGLGVFLGTMAFYGGGAVMSQSIYTDETRDVGTILLVTGGLIHLSSMIYAPIKARKINQSNGDTAFLNNKPKRELGFGVTSTGGAGFTLSF